MRSPFTCEARRTRRYLASERAAEDYCDEVVDGGGRSLYLDRVGSVSALVEVEDDFDYDSTHIDLNQGFIHHGS